MYLVVSLGVIGLIALASYQYLRHSDAADTMPYFDDSGTAFDNQNRYILRDFDLARPMSNFLNGLAGVWGIPMWAFYVNRGQAITSFGKQNKDSAIAKFVTVSDLSSLSPLL